MTKKIRLDLHLLTKGLANSRQQAIRLIRAGKVKTIYGEILDKPGKEIDPNIVLLVKKPPRFVSRGGEKLIAAFDYFSLSVEGKVCLDCGISTGGFTDCLLQKGARKVYGIDVGYGQTAWAIRNDPRVILKERTNIRNLKVEELFLSKDPKPEFFVADLSFISLKLVLPKIFSFLSSKNTEGVILVKPQFEVGKEKVGKRGIVKDPHLHEDVLCGLVGFINSIGWVINGLIASPITGVTGNQEYLMWISAGAVNSSINIKEIVRSAMTK